MMPLWHSHFVPSKDACCLKLLAVLLIGKLRCAKVKTSLLRVFGVQSLECLVGSFLSLCLPAGKATVVCLAFFEGLVVLPILSAGSPWQVGVFAGAWRIGFPCCSGI
jgi:hypothetical protein